MTRAIKTLRNTAAAVAMLGMAGAASAQDVKGLTIGGGSVGADFFVLGTALQKVLSDVYPGARIENTSTTGSLENLRLLRRKDIDLGLYTNTAVADAWHGRGAFASEPAFQEIRSIAGVFHFTYSIITLASSSLKDPADIKGKRIGIGPDAKTLKPLYAPWIEASSGLNYDTDIQHVYASYADIFRMLGEGRVDGVVGFTSGFKVPASLQELSSAKPLRWISMDAGKLAAAKLEPITFPPGALPGQTTPVTAAKFGLVAIAATTTMSDATAYSIAKAIHQNLKKLTELQPALGQAVTEPTTLAADTTPFPFHPGAQKYWTEAGLWKR
ncbi:MAG: TAXI family TRAP transporter solute-binding subunit [Alphaproteobacteria bacterium]|nr:TAXI family TRAP transporter solute-binding subunit [Alphaproteobacteria bacterium]